MERTYKIADRKIKISMPNTCYDESHINLFKCNDKEDIDINYELTYSKKHELNTGELLCTYSDLKVYKDNNITVWDYVNFINDEVYCSLVEKDKKNSEFYIYNDKEGLFNNTSEIFRKINIQGSLLKNDVMILHSNYIIHNNEAILFTAPSGTGKSTQGGLWEKYKYAEVVNGDRSCIALKGKEYFAYGLPFSGSSGISKNKEAKIKAIVSLEQGKENKIRRLNNMEAFKIILSQIAINRWNKEEVNIAINLIEKLIKNVPVIHLSCRPDKEATDVLEKYLINNL